MILESVSVVTVLTLSHITKASNSMNFNLGTTWMSLGWTQSKFECDSKIKLLSLMVISLYQVVHNLQFLLTQAMRGRNNKYLPMFWRSNQETQTMKQLLLEWFNYFGYKHDQYLKFKVLLVHDNTLGRLQNLGLIYPRP